MENQEIKAPQDKNNSSTVVVVFLGLVMLAMAGLIAYLVLNPVKSNEIADQTQTQVAEETKEMAEEGIEKEQKPDNNGSESPKDDSNTQNTVDIDKDLKTLDNLDISAPENDYAEDKLGDL